MVSCAWALLSPGVTYGQKKERTVVDFRPAVSLPGVRPNVVADHKDPQCRVTACVFRTSEAGVGKEGSCKGAPGIRGEDCSGIAPGALEKEGEALQPRPRGLQKGCQPSWPRDPPPKSPSQDPSLPDWSSRGLLRQVGNCLYLSLARRFLQMSLGVVGDLATSFISFSSGRPMVPDSVLSCHQ